VTDPCKAFSASIIFAYTQDLLDAEAGATEDSVKQRKRLKRMIGDVVKISDHYLPEEGFCQADVLKAIRAIDYINEHISRVYGEDFEFEEGDGI